MKRRFAGVRLSLWGVGALPPSRRCASTTPIVVGNQKVGVRDGEPFSVTHAELIGTLVPHQIKRVDAGDVLALIDVISARSGSYFLSGEKQSQVFRDISTRSDNAVSLVTVAFNSFVFSKPIFEGDLVLYEARVVSASNSTVGMHVEVSRQAYDAPIPEVIGESFVTFVAVRGKNIESKSADPVVPAVRLNLEKDISLHQRYASLRRFPTMKDAPSPLTAATLESASNQKKRVKVPMASTTVVVNRTFSKDSLNVNNVIFGGAVLRFMEKAALHCGRVFTESPFVYTLAMLNMTFEGPVRFEDHPVSTCRVVYVRNSTMLVTVNVAAEQGGTLRGTNKASFILMFTSSRGSLAEIPKGIDLTKASEEELRAYWLGQYEVEKSVEAREKKNISPSSSNE